MWTQHNGKFVYRDVARHSGPRVYHPGTSSSFSTHAHVVASHTHVASHVHDDETTTTADSGTFVDADGLPANGSAVAGIAQAGQIVSSGIVDAYVLDVAPRAKLSGVYDKTINGTAAGKVIIIYNELDNSFIMASTKSNELESLKLQFEALTGS
jgi:hypothetical protein